MSLITAIARKLHKKKQTPRLDSESEAPLPAPRPANSHHPTKLKELLAPLSVSPIVFTKWWKDKPMNSGTLNLPVEIWLEIFKQVCAAAVAPANIENEIKNIPSLKETCQLSTPTIISEYKQLQSPALFKTRHTLVLVCRAWYSMAISMLRSHIIIKNNKWPDGYSNLIETLRLDPTFGPSVMRISVIDEPDHWPRSQEPDWSQEGAQLVAQMASMMPNIRVFTCRYRLTLGFYFMFHPEVAIVYEEVARSYPEERPIYIKGQFFRNLITLSLSFQLALPSGSSSTPPIFPNLVDLTLNNMKVEPGKWLPNPQDMPNLLSLSISSGNPQNWIPTINLFSSQLEQLELLTTGRYCSDVEFPPMLMPRLRAVCLFSTSSIYYQHPAISWSREVKAPRLHRFCFHVETLKPCSVDFCWCLRGLVPAILQSYPLVDTLVVCDLIGVSDVRKELVATNPRENIPLTPEDIIEWCNLGLTVEVNGQFIKRMFTKETIGNLI